jgi:hypothetical protein
MSKVFLIDLTMQWGMLKNHCDRNIGPLYHAFIQGGFCFPSFLSPVLTLGPILLHQSLNLAEEPQRLGIVLPLLC